MVLELTVEQIGQACAWLVGFGVTLGTFRQAIKGLRTELAELRLTSSNARSELKAENKELRDRLDRLVESRGFAGSSGRDHWAPV